MNTRELERTLKKNNQPKFRLKQIQKAIFQDGVSVFSEISTIPKDLRDLLSKGLKILSFEPVEILASSDKRSIKALLKLGDGNLVETVLISPKPSDWSACVSSQVGCPLGCGFCATGRGGYKRNLTAEEITDQVLFWRMYITKNQKSNLKNQNDNSKLKIPASPAGGQNSKFSVVYMGMGEPFLNWEAVSQSLGDLTSPVLFGFGSRSISVSTAGIPEGIEKLANEFGQVNLALSLHFPIDEKRSRFMPINRKHNLEELRQSLRNYFAKCSRKVFLEYIMLKDINDGVDDADNLIKYIRSIQKPRLLHVNLIRYNLATDEKGTVEKKGIKPSEVGVVREFKDYLVRNGISATIRKSLGTDIRGACGQLAGEK